MGDRVDQSWLEAAHAEFNDIERFRLAEMRAYWKLAEEAGWKDRFIAAARAQLASAHLRDPDPPSPTTKR